MRRSSKLAFGAAAVIAVAGVLLLVRPSKRSGAFIDSRTPMSGDSELRLKSIEPKGAEIAAIPAPATATPAQATGQTAQELEGITTDPAVVKFWSTHKLQEVGEVRPTKNLAEQLWVGGRMVLEAAAIKNVRSMSKNGTIALAAAIGSASPSAPGQETASSEQACRIWLVDLNGNKKPVSPPSVDARRPLIAPSGNLVAFTGTITGEGDLSGSERLFVLDLKRGATRSFGANRPVENYQITAVEWSAGEKTLRALEDYGETGGHMTMRQIRLE